MKAQRYWIFAIIIVLFNVLSMPLVMDSVEETKVEVSLEVKKEFDKKLDEKLFANRMIHSVELRSFSGFDISLPLGDQRFLTDIFRPPITSLS